MYMFPDPTPGHDEHYLPIKERAKKKEKKRKTLPFVASIQHARNVNTVVQYGMWKLIYSKKKLTSQKKKKKGTREEKKWL